MSLTNRVENTIISIVTAMVTITATVLIINFTAIKPLEKQLQQQNSLIKELAELEKYQIENNFEKLKSHKGQIVLDLNNDMSISAPDTTVVLPTEPESQEEKVSFFKRLFKGRK